MLWILVALLVFIFQIATILIVEFRSAVKTVAWLLILFFVPLIGFVLYYFVAREYKQRRKLRGQGSKLSHKINSQLNGQSDVIDSLEQMKNKSFQYQERLFGLLSRLPESPITGCNEVRVLKDGEETFRVMLEEIEKAQDHIHMEFYIFRSDMIGTRFQEALTRKAREGIKVRIICDGLGSIKTSRTFVTKLRQAGVEFVFFLPPLIALLDKRLNYRNHRKIVVIDGKIGFMGGINIGDDYLGLHPKMGNWRDTELLVEGDAVYALQLTFLGDWRLATDQEVDLQGLFPLHRCQGSQQIQILASGPDQNRDSIQEMCFGAIAVAKHRVWITTPYFIPDQATYEALRTAALSGVDVRIIIPYHSDNRLVHWASLSYVEDLLEVGVTFYQYATGFVHAKTMIVDDLLGTVGSANLDMRSFYYNFELTAVLFDSLPIEELERHFLQDTEDSRAILLDAFKRRPIRQKAMEILGRLLSPLL